MNIYSLREKEMKLQDSFNVFIPYGDGFVCCCDFYGYIFPTGKRDEIISFPNDYNPINLYIPYGEGFQGGVVFSMDIYSLREKEMKLQDLY